MEPGSDRHSRRLHCLRRRE